MKRFIVLALVLATVSISAARELQKGSNGIIQGAAPNGTKSSLLTVYSTTVNMSDDIWWELYSPTACKYRILPTTAKAAWVQHSATADGKVGYAVNNVTPFINFSGCTNGELKRH